MQNKNKLIFYSLFFVLFFHAIVYAISAPTISISGKGSNSVSLSWDHTAQVYDVKVSDNERMAPFYEEYTTTSTSYTVNGRDPNKFYCFQVKATSGTESALSNVVCTTTISNIPKSIILTPSISVFCSNILLPTGIHCMNPNDLVDLLLDTVTTPPGSRVEVQTAQRGEVCGAYVTTDPKVVVRSCFDMNDVCDIGQGTNGICVDRQLYTGNPNEYATCGYDCRTAYDLTNTVAYAGVCQGGNRFKVTVPRSCEIRWTLVSQGQGFMLYYNTEANKCQAAARVPCSGLVTNGISTCTFTAPTAGTYYAEVVKGGAGVGPLSVSATTTCTPGSGITGQFNTPGAMENMVLAIRGFFKLAGL